jgi:hypothetical protein
MAVSVFTLYTEEEAVCELCRRPVDGGTAFHTQKMTVRRVTDEIAMDLNAMCYQLGDGGPVKPGALIVEHDYDEYHLYHVACYRLLTSGVREVVLRPHQVVQGNVTLAETLSYVRANVVQTRCELAATRMREIIERDNASVLRFYKYYGKLKVQLQVGYTKVTYTWHAGRWSR